MADYATLHNNDKPVFERITDEWAFSLRFVNFKILCKKNLAYTSFSTGLYIKDKTLLSKEAAIEASFCAGLQGPL